MYILQLIVKKFHSIANIFSFGRLRGSLYHKKPFFFWKYQCGMIHITLILGCRTGNLQRDPFEN